jgi:Mrp family chromosome partitioning ATPase
MTDRPARRTRRPRLDSGARERILAKIAKLDRPPAEEIEEATGALRNLLRADPVPVVEETHPDPDRSGQAGRTIRDAEPAPAAPAVQDSWTRLRQFRLDGTHLEDKLVITANRSDPAHGAFDVLRTRLVQALADKGWTRVAITSPTAGCGKSFTAVNLAITLSRYDSCRTVLLDFDMRRPALARYFGLERTGSIGDYLRGFVPLEDHLVRPARNRLHVGERLAIGLNDRPEAYAAELFQQPEAAAVMTHLDRTLNPEVVLLDLPPALAQDDVIAARPHFDCVLMVVGGGMTTAAEIEEATRRIGEDKPVMGIVLNKADIEGDYAY